MSSEKEQLARQRVIQKKQEQSEPGSQKDSGGGGVLSAGDMQALQGMVGNTAVGQLGQVQRAPQENGHGHLENASQAAFQNIVQRTSDNSGGNVIQRLPALDTIPRPKEDRRGIGATFLGKEQSKRYKPVYNAVRQFHLGVDLIIAREKQARYQQMETILQLYDEVITRSEKYLEEASKKIIGGDTKLNAVSALLKTATRERVAFVEAGMSIVRQRFVPRGTRWSFVIGNINTNQNLVAPERVALNEGNYQGSVGGGMNQLRMYNQDNMMGFFKSNQNQAPTEEDVMEINNQVMLGNATQEEYNAADNLNFLAVKTLGINHQNLQLQNRDLAMSRLDSLLGSNVIARTELAMQQDGVNQVQGSLMAGAQGRKAGEGGNYEPTGQNAPNQDQIDLEGGELQRQLSKLQILDLLARQVDRNQGNFFLATDGNGQVTKVTGIDNDMSFGERNTSIAQKLDGVGDYPRVSAYVDKQMAQRIMRIDAQDIQFILGDLLPQEEINATVNRLLELQEHLKTLEKENKLLEPNQWDEVTSQKLLDEEKQGYYSRLAGAKLNWQNN